MQDHPNAAIVPLGVAIVSYNTCDLLRTCLASLRRSSVTTAVAVVDNGSHDESVAMMRREFPEVLVIVPEANLGFAKGTNLAMQALRDAHPTMEFMMMLNPDTEVHEGALATLIDFLQTHPRVGVVSPRLVNSDGSLQRAAFRFPTPSMTCLELFPPGEVTPGRLYDSWWNGRYAQEVVGSAPFAIDHPLGACMVTRVAVIAAVGMLDDGYFMYAEEVDWCQRVHAAGWVIWQVPAAVVTQVGGASSRQFKAAMLRALWQSRRQYWQRWCSPSDQWWHLFWLRWGMRRQCWLAWRQYQRGQLSRADYQTQIAVYREVGA